MEKTYEKGLLERVVRVKRVAKVVKGGRRFSFNALVVVGDGFGKVGYGLGKANEVSEAIRKAVNQATKQMKNVVLEGTSVPHEVIGNFGAGKVLIKPASKGHGVIAAGAVRSVMEAAGVSDISVKSLGSRTPHNLVRAAFDGLLKLRSFSDVATLRGKTEDYLRDVI